jgi:hypothetical protein
VLASVQGLIKGQAPSTQSQTEPITGTPLDQVGGPATDATPITPGKTPSSGGGNAKTALMNAAATRGWNTGAQWTALDAIEMQEAGYDPTNTNPSSKAYGLAQSLGHGFSGGPAANGINEYGGNGLTPAQSRAASMGDPGPQSIWMVNYIAARYGTPVVAEQFHLANNWY